MKIPLDLPFSPDTTLVAIVLDFLTGPRQLGFMPRGRLRGIRLQANDIDRVWGEGEASANVVDRYVAYLRRKLGDPPLIHTVRGVGFRLE